MRNGFPPLPEPFINLTHTPGARLAWGAQMQAYTLAARADLEAEVARLRDALERIESMCAAPPNFSDATIQEVARAALKDTK